MTKTASSITASSLSAAHTRNPKEGRVGTPQPALTATPLPRFRRSADAPPFVLQTRDLALLEDLWHYRVLTTSQLETLRGADPDPSLRFVSRLTLTRRLKLLFHGKYLRRLARPSVGGMQEPVYLLDGEGAKALSRLHGEVPVRPPSQTPKLAALEHRLAINGFRIALTAACAATRGKSAEFKLLDWQGSEQSRFTVALAINQKDGRASPRKVTLLPDGFFLLKTPKMKVFYFLEVDLGSEVSRILTDKCRAYYAFWQSGGFGEAHGVEQKVGFRVLFVAPTAKRAGTILGAVRKLDAGRVMFWVTTCESITPERILRPIWQSAANNENHSDRADPNSTYYNLAGHALPPSRS